MTPNRPVFLDNQSTTPLDPRVWEAMVPWFTQNFANPHSVEHAMGRAAEAAVDTARADIDFAARALIAAHERTPSSLQA